MLQVSRGILASSSNWNVKRIREGFAEAVTLMLIPMELKETTTGAQSLWQVAVTQDSKGNQRVVSSEQQKGAFPEVSVSSSMLQNTTMEAVIQQLVLTVPEKIE
jgi:hypothetical protein